MRDPEERRDGRAGRQAASGLALLALLASCAERPAVPTTYGLAPGDLRVYEIEHGTVSRADLRALFEETGPAGPGSSPAAPGGPRSFRTLLRGRLLLTVLESGPDGFLFAYRVEDPRVEVQVEGQDATGQAAVTAALLGRETFAMLDSRGRLRGVLLPPQTDQMTKGFILALLSRTQFVLPPRTGSEAAAWTAEEEDPNGRYRARYEASSSFAGRSVRAFPKGAAAFRKTKVAYLPAGAANEALLRRLPTVVEPAGAIEMLFDTKGGGLEAAAGEETERITVSGREVARVESRFSLRRVGGGTVPSSELVALREAFRWHRTSNDLVPLTMALSEEESEQAIQRTALGPATIESLTADLAAAEAAGRKPELDLYLKFKALIYLQPEVSADLGERLAAAPAASVTGDVIGGALGAVGHPQAQAALAKALLARREEPEFAVGLIQALSQVRFPAGAAERALRDLAAGPGGENLRAAALLGLGTMSRSLKETDPVRAERIAEDLVALLTPSQTETSADIVLKALGNSGSTRALPVMRKYVSSGSARLRASAAAGLRFDDSVEADRILTSVLTSDEDALARTSALLALGFRQPTAATAEAHIRALSRDESEAVRLAALNNMGSWADGFPGVLAAIRRAAEEDGSESVRKTAADILSRREKDNAERR
jgi:hypothetical protein